MPGKPVTLKPPRKMIIVINCIILYYYILKHFFTLSDFISDRYIMSFLRACDPQALPSIDMYFGPPLSIYSIVSTVENAVFRPGSQWQSRAASLFGRLVPLLGGKRWSGTSHKNAALIPLHAALFD